MTLFISRSGKKNPRVRVVVWFDSVKHPAPSHPLGCIHANGRGCPSARTRLHTYALNGVKIRVATLLARHSCRREFAPAEAALRQEAAIGVSRQAPVILSTLRYILRGRRARGQSTLDDRHSWLCIAYRNSPSLRTERILITRLSYDIGSAASREHRGTLNNDRATSLRRWLTLKPLCCGRCIGAPRRDGRDGTSDGGDEEVEEEAVEIGVCAHDGDLVRTSRVVERSQVKSCHGRDRALPVFSAVVRAL
ncbi:hypothetical protein KM043_002435 [Ampulex compressa]|nr:hypothetical protein KM043_002435 [Ampulex compressa]